MTPSGIEPATFRFVMQYLNHCATVVFCMKVSHEMFSAKVLTAILAPSNLNYRLLLQYSGLIRNY
jgi:hypothetical protein